MKSIKVNLKEQPYNIVIGTRIIKLLGKFLHKLDIGSDAYIITNAAIKNRYGKILEKILRQSKINAKFKSVPDTEKSKSMKTAFSVIKDIASFDKKIRLFIVAFGGGVVGDLAGFVASIYKRGIPYIQVPTTLLAQVDSGIGGKTAVDLTEGKNLIGTFYQPRLVFSDIEFLKTLNIRQIRTGLAEVIKYGVIKDPRLFTYLEKNYPDILNLKPQALEFIVKRSSSIKAEIVQQDEKEKKGVRTILNFGHTIGHALERAADYKKYTHGEAIALGMLIASDLSKNLKLINAKIQQRIENIIKAVGLPTTIKKASLEEIIKAHYHDKKFIGHENRFVLLKGIGKTVIVKNISLQNIRGVLRKRLYSTSA